MCHRQPSQRERARPLDARCLRPEGWISTCVMDKLLEKFADWADAPHGVLGVANSSHSYELVERLRAEPDGPWSRQAPGQRRLQLMITQHRITLLPVCVGGHWASMIFENRGTTGVVHLYNSIRRYGQQVLHQLARMATRHYAGAGAFPVTWLIRQEECPQQLNGFDCGLVTITVLLEIGGRHACGFSTPASIQLPDLQQLQTRLALLLAEPLADWTSRVGPRCF